MEWLAANIGTVIIVLLLVAAVAGAIAVMIRDRKKGRPACGGCGGNCAACGLCGSAAEERGDGEKAAEKTESGS